MSKASYRLRSMESFRVAASSVNNVALIPEVQHALTSWIKRTVPNERGVLIGGLAMAFYAPPRTTQDVDMLYLHSSDIPGEVVGFKYHRKGAFQENTTHVEVEVVAADTIGIPSSVAKRVVDTAVTYDGVKVASLQALIVLKLYGAKEPRRRFKDLGDVQRLLEHNRAININLGEWSLSKQQMAWLTEITHSLMT